MNNSEKIAKLVERFGRSVQIFEKKKVFGFIPFTFSGGWLWIEDSGDHWSVTLASGKESHQAFGGPALGADFQKDDGERKISPVFSGTWQSAISMWPITDETKAISVFDHISSRVDLAFRFHCEES